MEKRFLEYTPHHTTHTDMVKIILNNPRSQQTDRSAPPVLDVYETRRLRYLLYIKTAYFNFYLI